MQKTFWTVLLFLLIDTIGYAQDNSVVNEGLRDVRAPVNFPANYIALLVLFILLLMTGLVIYTNAKRKKKAEAEQAPVDTRLPWEIAYDQLDRLARSPYLREGRFKEYYSELSGIIRYYFENRFNIRAPEMTTEEFLWSLEQRSSQLTDTHKRTLKQFMMSCDIIKFAKHVPRAEEAEESFRFAQQLIEETKIKNDT